MSNAAAASLHVITVRAIDGDPCAFARFTWSADMQDCNILEMGMTDAQLDAIVEGNGHEGLAVAGFTIEIA